METIIRLLFLLLSIVYLADAACPDGWIRHGQMCYHFSHDLENWTGAKTMCEAMRGQLVEIETAEENHLLAQNAKLNGKHYWIALSDVIEEDTWVWMNSLIHATYTHWGSGEPTNSGGNENCVLLVSNGYWNDGTCSGLLNFICEKKDEVEVIVGKR